MKYYETFGTSRSLQMISAALPKYQREYIFTWIILDATFVAVLLWLTVLKQKFFIFFFYKN